MIEPPSNFIYLTHGAAAFLGTIEDNAVHKHYAIQLTIGVDGAFTLETDNGTKKYEISILDSNTEHKLVGNEGVQLLLLIEPDSLFATSLRKI